MLTYTKLCGIVIHVRNTKQATEREVQNGNTLHNSKCSCKHFTCNVGSHDNPLFHES